MVASTTGINGLRIKHKPRKLLGAGLALVQQIIDLEYRKGVQAHQRGDC